MPIKAQANKSLTRTTPKIIFALVIAACLLLVLEATNTTHFFHKQVVPVSGSSYTKGESTSPEPKSKSSVGNSIVTNDSSQPGDTKSVIGGNNSGQTLLAPSTDSLVSNHHISLSANPGMSSVCTTTPGATCTITFINGTVIKALSSEVTDRGGSAYWNWKPQDYGINLTTGTWQVKATATLNGQSQTSSDAMTLEVNQ